MHAPVHPIRSHARILAASMVGTAVEFYDFYIYATAAALVFGPLFFPAQEPGMATLLSFMTFALAFFSRPVGAVAFGHFGDRLGRKSTLVVSMMVMGLSTFLIAFLPTYAFMEGFGAGWLAPALLCVLRFGQGFGLGGEWGGATLLAVENAPKGWEARFGCTPQLGAPIGFLAANGLFLLLGLGLSEQDFASWGWRIPFLLSALLVAIGLWVRLKISETPAFRAALEREAPAHVPVWEMRRHGWTLIAGTAGVIVCFANFYLYTAYALAQGTGPLGYSREVFLGVQLAANSFLAVGILASAVLADRLSPRTVLAWGAAATVLVGLVFGPGLASGSLLGIFLTISLAALVMGATCGLLGSWLPSLFPVRLRYTGISLAFNVGGIFGGGVTPILAQLMAERGLAAQAGWLLSLTAVISLAGILLARPSNAAK